LVTGFALLGTLLGTRDQMLVLPKNPLRLQAPRPMQGGQ
jgi:hypothetical protein